MSIAVAVRKGRDIVLATDSQTDFGAYKPHADNLSSSKTRQIGTSLLAATGWCLYDNIFDDFLAKRRVPALTTKSAIFSFLLKLWKELHDRYPFVNDQCDKEGDSPFGDLDSSFLLVNASGVYYVAPDLSVAEFKKYHATGSGRDYALGALHALYDQDLDAEQLARQAVQAAVSFDLHCGGEVCVTKIRARAKAESRAR